MSRDCRSLAGRQNSALQKGQGLARGAAELAPSGHNLRKHMASQHKTLAGSKVPSTGCSRQDWLLLCWAAPESDGNLWTLWNWCAECHIELSPFTVFLEQMIKIKVILEHKHSSTRPFSFGPEKQPKTIAHKMTRKPPKTNRIRRPSEAKLGRGLVGVGGRVKRLPQRTHQPRKKVAPSCSKIDP